MDMRYCSTCGFEYDALAGDCPACAEPEKYLPLVALEALAEEHGEESSFAVALRKFAARTVGRHTSDAKRKASAENGKKGGRPKKSE